MALQVWLPLNGNLNNQGLSNVTVTNSGTTVNSAGKIGSCYAFTESQYMVLNNVPFSQLGNCSVCFWIYLASNESWLPCTGGSAGSNTGQYFLATEGGTGAFYHSNIGSNTKTIYRDGVVGTTPLASGAWHHYCITGLDLSSWSGLTINHYGTYSGWNFNGRLNDFRIYDHCLSPKEVKEISKGLVLHYKLDDPYVEGTTNLSNPLYATASNTGWGAHRGTSTLVTAPSGVPFSQCNKLDVTYNTSWGSGGGVGIFCSSITVEPSTTYCYSTYILPDDNLAYSVSNFLYRYEYASGTKVTETGIYTSSKKQYIGNGWYRIYNTFTTSSTTNNVQLYFYTYPGKNITYYLGGVQLEKKDHLTPFVNGTRAQGQIYDCSGYGRNGTITGSVVMNNDSPRYATATRFASVNDCINHSNDNLFGALSNCSVSFWYYLETKGSSGWLPCGGQDNYYYFLATTNGTGTFYHGNVGSNSKVIYVDGVPQGTPAQSVGWHHYVITGLNLTSWTVIGLNNYDIAYKTNWRAICRFSDYRIYSTVLSESDIKDLYQTSAAIHNTGNIETFEFIEDGDSNIKKTGIVESGYFFEKGDNLKTLSDGSVWLRLLHHNNPTSNLFTTTNCWDNNTANLYSKLGWLKTGNWANTSGEYEFLVCEKLTSSSSEQQCRWKQTSNPSISSAITGYSLISGSPGRSVGLKTNGAYAAMHNGDTWWCACGSYTAFNGGIPGFFGTVTSGYVDLYVRLVGPTASGIDDSARIYANTISGNQLIEI